MTDLAGPRRGSRAGGAVRGVLGLVGGVVRLITGLFAVVLVVHIAFVLLGANPDNAAARFVAAAADALTLGLANLFVVESPTAQLLLSYGIPALAWLVIGAVIVGILRLLGRPRSGLA